MMRIILTLFCIYLAGAEAYEPGFRVRFGLENIGTEYFVELPTTLVEAYRQGWTQAARPNAIMPSLALLVHPSNMVGVMYDDTGYVAGLQVAIPEDEFTDAVYDWLKQGFSRWNYNGKIYWATHVYFVTQGFLNLESATRIEMRNSSKLYQLDGVWVSGIDGQLVRMGDKTIGVLAEGFTEQACIPYMGLHYYRDMRSTLPCNAETMFPWFALMDKAQGELIATGLVIFGKLPEAETDWFERPDQSAVKMIVPNGPQCLYDQAASPGLITMHIYYVNEPWTITC